jgi:2-methylisocitrate lyase-like PEP mutase family enzyme
MASPELRNMLARGEVFFAPAVWDAVTARLARHSGFKALYIPGEETGLVVGEPRDLTTLTQTVMIAERALEGVDDELPMIVDVLCTSDAQMRQAVRTLEDAAITAMHVEDTPATSIDGLKSRLAAAIATRRSRDFLVIAGIHAAGAMDRNQVVERAQAAQAAGADAILIKGMRPGTDDMSWYRKAIPNIAMAAVPCEGAWFTNDRGEPLSLEEYRSLGYQLILYPRVIQPAMQAVKDVYQHVKDDGRLPVIPQEQLDDVMEVWWTLVGMEEKWAVESATTETGK